LEELSGEEENYNWRKKLGLRWLIVKMWCGKPGEKVEGNQGNL